MADEARILWGQADYERAVAELIAKRDDHQASALALSIECARRYGQGPGVPPVIDDLTEDDD